MGNRGMRAIGNLALGSTSTKVIHLAEVPVTSSSSGPVQESNLSQAKEPRRLPSLSALQPAQVV